MENIAVKDNDVSYHPSGESDKEDDEEETAQQPTVVQKDEQMDNSLDDFVVPDTQKNSLNWLDFSWEYQCHFLVEYLSNGKMLHKDKWEMDKHKKYDFKCRAKKFYLNMNGELYTKVSHKDNIKCIKNLR